MQGTRELWYQGFGLKIKVLPRVAFLISSGINIIACNFMCFSANDDRGRQVATGNGASCRDNNRSGALKRGHQTFIVPDRQQIIIIIIVIVN